MSVKMTRQHFEFIADTLNDLLIYQAKGNDVTVEIVIGWFASDLNHTNQNFDSQRFISACTQPKK